MDLRRIGFTNYVKYAIKKTKIRLADYRRGHGKVLIVGAYDGYNAGDMALMDSSVSIADKIGLSYRARNINNVDLGEVKKEQAIVFGGGATFTLSVAKQISQQNASINPSRVTLMGVDVQGADKHYSDGVVSFINDIKYISVRQKRQKEILDSKIKKEVVWHPDISFMLYGKFSRRLKRNTSLGVNVLPFMAMRDGLKWESYYPWKNLERNKKNRREEAKISKKYILLMRGLVKQAIDRGYDVWHHPFTLADELFARSIFRGLNVRHQKYTPYLSKNIERFNEYSGMIASRLHAHIFAMMKEIPIISFAYSHKCVSLFEDLEGPVPERQLSRYNILQHKVEEVDLESLWFHPGDMAENARSEVQNRIREIEWYD